MSRVIAAGKPDYHIGLRGYVIYNLAFTFVSPLRANDRYRWHSVSYLLVGFCLPPDVE
jgi:hypothetical protein